MGFLYEKRMNRCGGWWDGGWHKLSGTRECELLELSRDPRCRRAIHIATTSQPASIHNMPTEPKNLLQLRGC